ncbi:MAG: D-alanyl-D-alanine carboxypeptidase, partial [Myxococcota bacterium]
MLILGVLAVCAPVYAEDEDEDDPITDAGPAPDAGPITDVGAVAPVPIDARIAQLLSRPVMQGVQVSFDAVNLRTGARIASYSPDLKLNPASVAKVVTSAAALETLGPYFRFPTDILAAEHPVNGVVNGDLFFRGHGDPRLTSEQVFLMAAELRQRGIKKITGGVVVDESAFDSELEPRGWEKDRGMGAYYAVTGALSVNFNSVTVVTMPGQAGGSAVVAIEPPIPYFKLSNKAVTTSTGCR